MTRLPVVEKSYSRKVFALYFFTFTPIIFFFSFFICRLHRSRLQLFFPQYQILIFIGGELVVEISP